MELPKHFTVSQVVKAIDKIIITREEKLKELRCEVLEAQEVSTKSFFGLFSYEESPNMFATFIPEMLEKECKDLLQSLRNKKQALRKYPDDALILLTVAETNLYFG